MYFVLYEDDFGEKKVAQFGNYAEAYEFYKRPSNVVFPYEIVSESQLWLYCTTTFHLGNRPPKETM